MSEKFIKRGYNFSEELLDAWEKFHAPSKDYSPSAAAAFLEYMILEPAVREQLRKLACQENIESAKTEARKIIREAIVDSFLSGFVGIHSEEDRKILLDDALRTAKKLSRK